VQAPKQQDVCAINNADVLTISHLHALTLPPPSLRCIDGIAGSRMDVEVSSGGRRNGGCGTWLWARGLPPSLPGKGFGRRQGGRMWATRMISQ
jgi:hypothetical protein